MDFRRLSRRSNSAEDIDEEGVIAKSRAGVLERVRGGPILSLAGRLSLNNVVVADGHKVVELSFLCRARRLKTR